MSRELASGEIDLKCMVEWVITENDFGDVEAHSTLSGCGEMPSRMAEDIGKWLHSNPGMDWILTRPRNRRETAAERKGNGQVIKTNRAGVPAAG